MNSYRPRNRNRRRSAAATLLPGSGDQFGQPREIVAESQGSERYSRRTLSELRRILDRNADLATTPTVTVYLSNAQKRQVNDFLGQTYFTVT